MWHWEAMHLRLGAWDPGPREGLCPLLQVSKQAGLLQKLNLQEVLYQEEV